MGIGGITKLSLLDYPGKICCIVFTTRCNFYCPFCHNGLTLLPSKDEIEEKELLSFLESRVGKLEAVTITGGEPTLLPNLADLMRKIKALGYSIKLDTNGTNPEVIFNLIKEKLVDYIAMDVKNSLGMYSKTCGINNADIENIKKSIEIIKNSGVLYEFRTTLIEEFHSQESIEEMGKLLEGSQKLFLQKFKISDGVINKNLHSVSEDSALLFKDILSKYIDEVSLRGYSDI